MLANINVCAHNAVAVVGQTVQINKLLIHILFVKGISQYADDVENTEQRAAVGLRVDGRKGISRRIGRRRFFSEMRGHHSNKPVSITHRLKGEFHLMRRGVYKGNLAVFPCKNHSGDIAEIHMRKYRAQARCAPVP